MGTRITLLLRRRDIVELVGTNYSYINKLIDTGTLEEIRPIKSGRAFFRRDDIERIFKIKLYER